MIEKGTDVRKTVTAEVLSDFQLSNKASLFWQVLACSHLIRGISGVVNATESLTDFNIPAP